MNTLAVLFLSLIVSAFAGEIIPCGFVLGSSAGDANSLVGAVVTVTFIDGATQSAPFALVGDIVCASTADFDLCFGADGGDSFASPFSFDADAPVQSFCIDCDIAVPKCVFDILADNTPTTSTPGSAAGKPYTPISGPAGVGSYSKQLPLSVTAGDLWFKLCVTFGEAGLPAGGSDKFVSDTDVIVARSCGETCDSLGVTVDELEVNYLPHIDSDASYIYYEETALYLHIVITAPWVVNRAHGLDEANAYWLTFDAAGEGCVAGTDYNWVYTAPLDPPPNNVPCVETFTLDISQDLFQACGFDEVNTGEAYTVDALIDIVTREHFTIERDNGDLVQIVRNGYSQEGVTLIIDNTVNVLADYIDDYANPDVDAVIDEYHIPQGNQPKIIILKTLIQDPDGRGFHLFLLDDLPEPLTQTSGTPSGEGEISATIQPIGEGEGSNFSPCELDTQTSVQTCDQHWQITVNIDDPTVCSLDHVVYPITFGIACNSFTDVAIFCPIDPSLPTPTYTLEVDLTTDDWCGFIIGNFSLTGTLESYFTTDPVNVHRGFFTDTEVLWKVVVDDTAANFIHVSHVHLIYLAAVLTDDVSPALFPPDFVDSPPGYILVGGADTTAHDEAEVDEDVCDLYTCAANELFFTFKLSSSLWHVTPDDFDTLHVGAIVSLEFAGIEGKRFVKLLLQSQSGSQHVGSVIGVTGSSPSAGSALQVVTAFLLACIAFLVALM